MGESDVKAERLFQECVELLEKDNQTTELLGRFDRLFNESEKRARIFVKHLFEKSTEKAMIFLDHFLGTNVNKAIKFIDAGRRVMIEQFCKAGGNKSGVMRGNLFFDNFSSVISNLLPVVVYRKFEHGREKGEENEMWKVFRKIIQTTIDIIDCDKTFALEIQEKEEFVLGLLTIIIRIGGSTIEAGKYMGKDDSIVVKVDDMVIKVEHDALYLMSTLLSVYIKKNSEGVSYLMRCFFDEKSIGWRICRILITFMVAKNVGNPTKSGSLMGPLRAICLATLDLICTIANRMGVSITSFYPATMHNSLFKHFKEEVEKEGQHMGNTESIIDFVAAALYTQPVFAYSFTELFFGDQCAYVINMLEHQDKMRNSKNPRLDNVRLLFKVCKLLRSRYINLEVSELEENAEKESIAKAILKQDETQNDEEMFLQLGIKSFLLDAYICIRNAATKIDITKLLDQLSNATKKWERRIIVERASNSFQFTEFEKPLLMDESRPVDFVYDERLCEQYVAGTQSKVHEGIKLLNTRLWQIHMWTKLLFSIYLYIKVDQSVSKETMQKICALLKLDWSSAALPVETVIVMLQLLDIAIAFTHDCKKNATIIAEALQHILMYIQKDQIQNGTVYSLAVSILQKIISFGTASELELELKGILTHCFDFILQDGVKLEECRKAMQFVAEIYRYKLIRPSGKGERTEKDEERKKESINEAQMLMFIADDYIGTDLAPYAIDILAVACKDDVIFEEFSKKNLFDAIVKYCPCWSNKDSNIWSHVFAMFLALSRDSQCVWDFVVQQYHIISYFLTEVWSDDRSDSVVETQVAITDLMGHLAPVMEIVDRNLQRNMVVMLSVALQNVTSYLRDRATLTKWSGTELSSTRSADGKQYDISGLYNRAKRTRFQNSLFIAKNCLSIFASTLVQTPAISEDDDIMNDIVCDFKTFDCLLVLMRSLTNSLKDVKTAFYWDTQLAFTVFDMTAFVFSKLAARVNNAKDTVEKQKVGGTATLGQRHENVGYIKKHLQTPNPGWGDGSFVKRIGLVSHLDRFLEKREDREVKEK